MIWNLVSNSKCQNDESRFLRNVKLAAANRKKGKRGSGDILSNLVGELSFWNAVSSDEKSGQKQRRSRSSTGWKSLAGSLSFASRAGVTDGTKSRKDTLCPGAKWKTAIDPSTGKTYYYDSLSRKTQWDKPFEVKEYERRQKLERRQRDAAFFKEMERNILNSLERGELIPAVSSKTCPVSDSSNSIEASRNASSPVRGTSMPFERQKEDNCINIPSTRIRTISAMDEVLLAELRVDELLKNQVESVSTKSGRPPRPTGSSRGRVIVGNLPDGSSAQLELTPDPTSKVKFSEEDITSHLVPAHEESLVGERLLDNPIHDEGVMIAEISTIEPSGAIPRAQHTRRNTGGTMNVQNTIYNPNIQATIMCVCGVYRAHIVQASENKRNHPLRVYSQRMTKVDMGIFLDEQNENVKAHAKTSIPSLLDLLGFYEEFYNRSKMEHDTIIMSLIYIERLIKSTNSALAPCAENWRSILFACMVLASKVWDDLSMWNIDFSNVSAATVGLSSFTLSRINKLELSLLKVLDFNVSVSASEYARYYFLIRTMLQRSGRMEETSLSPIERKSRPSTSNVNSPSTGISCRQYKNESLDMPPKALSPGNGNKYLPTPPRPDILKYRVKSLDGGAIAYLNADIKSKMLGDFSCLEQLIG